MSVDTETVRKVARLARIAEPEERLAPLADEINAILGWIEHCLLYTSPSPRDQRGSRMPSSA